ncbi:hypothetical protein [Aestuariivirga sp.]|uniref:hypothetical protein n=1 Tax=Aestuariivirga sp. TaxID=2650926 RepID=UPI0025C72577|nr:hypothetical protein [Aestuariivirga sp.]
MAEARPALRPQQWSAGRYATHARFVSGLASGVVEWLAPKPSERILDLGCGDGVLTADLLRLAPCCAGGNRTADYVRLRVEAVKA